MIFSPRFIKGIWKILRWKLLFNNNPDAPSEEAFLAHYYLPNADSGFSWSDRVKGVTYLYDLSINQVQVDPAIEAFAWRIKEANGELWKFLPPHLLDEPADWKERWFEAVSLSDTATMRFIREQGFDANTVMQPADWKKLWFKAAHHGDAKMIDFILQQDIDADTFLQPVDWTQTWFLAANLASVEMMRLLLNRGFHINTLDQHGDSALPYVVGLYGGHYPAVEFLVEAGIKLEKIEELIEMGLKSVTCGGEASEQRKIANYLRRKAAEQTKSAADAGTN